MRAKDLLVEFYEPQNDQTIKQKYNDTRRPRLTMRHLRKLRYINDHETVDRAEYLEFLPTMYGQKSE